MFFFLQLIKLFALNKAKLPNLKGLKINGIIPNCLYLKDFFAYCFPDKLKYFCLGSRYGNDINIKNFQKSLFPHLCKVEEEIFLWRCRFEDTETFNNFIKCSRNCKRIVSNRCTHRLAKPCDFNFKNKSEYLIECISFGSYYACDDTPGFSKDKASFENFAKGVKSCKDLCKSLKTIQIDKDQLNPNTVIDILKKDTNISQMFLEGRCDPLI